MGSASVLLRQRGRGHVDVIRRADGRRMATVRKNIILLGLEFSVFKNDVLDRFDE